MDKKNRYNIINSFNSAITGFIYAFRRERNIKAHFIIALLVITGGFFLNIPLSKFLLLLIVINMVFITELINTSVEMLANKFHPEYDREAKLIKDISASAVLISAIIAVITGYLIFAKHFPMGWRNIFLNIAGSPWYLSFAALIIVIILTIGMKFLIEKKISISGGMPSIHSVMAFSIWTAISFFTFKEFPIISLLVLILAFWVAQSRVLRGIHKIEEVIIGAVIGILFTMLMFQIFWR
jgi:diacylglycerol kinase (ATP)